MVRGGGVSNSSRETFLRLSRFRALGLFKWSGRTQGLREGKPGGFQTGGFSCVVELFGSVPRRCCLYREKEEKDKSGKSTDESGKSQKIGKVPKRTKKNQKGPKRTEKDKNEGQVQIRKPPRLTPARLAALEKLDLTTLAIWTLEIASSG